MIGEFDSLEGGVKGSGEFTGDAVMGKTVAAVGRQADFEDIGMIRRDGFGNADVEDIGDGSTDFRRRIEAHQRLVVIAQPQLDFAAQHTERNLATEFGFFNREVFHVSADGRKRDDPAFFNTGGTANDADEFGFAAVGIDEMEVIRIGMFLNFNEFCDFDVADTCRIGRMSFDFETAGCDFRGRLRGSQIARLDHILKPFPADKHCISLCSV